MIACAVVAMIATPAFASCGGASWYSLPHNRTANGERMNPHAMTAAHKTLKFGTRVTVTNMKNGKSVVVRINDRGPFVRGRIIDLSKAPARHIGMISSGHAKVCISHGGIKKMVPKENRRVRLFSSKESGR